MPIATCAPVPPLESLELMEPGHGEAPFNSPAWAFALPTPGYRMLAECGGRGDGGRLRSRRGVDASRWFPEVARALASLRLAGRTVLDGDICVLDAAGRSDLQRLHQRAQHPGRQPDASAVVLCVQDVLVWDGCDVRDLPWTQRRRLLGLLPLREGQALRLQRTLNAEGLWLARQARALGHGAIHAHRRDAPYVAGINIGWLRIACESARAVGLAA